MLGQELVQDLVDELRVGLALHGVYHLADGATARTGNSRCIFQLAGTRAAARSYSLEAVGHFETAVAASGKEGIDLARADRPDLILMDMMMPGMDGLTALAELRSIPDLKDIPVLFMTAKVQRSEVAFYVEKGAVGVIQKPFDPMTLPSEIRKILDAAPAR